MAMMLMAEEPERRRKLSASMSTTIAVPSPEEIEPIRIIKEAAITSSSSPDTDPSEEQVDKEDEESGSPGVREMMTTGCSNEEREGVEEAGGETEDSQSDEVVNYSINPNSLSTPSPSSPAGSLKSNSGGCGGANSATRRIFTPEFKHGVLEAFTNDPECIGNQRATARKFGVHRRQVQKWLQHLTGNINFKDQNSSDEQEQKTKQDNETESSYTNLHSVSSAEAEGVSAETSTNSVHSGLAIVTGKVPLLTQASSVLTYPSPSLSSSSPLTNLRKTMGSLNHPMFPSASPSMYSSLPHSLITGNPPVPTSFENLRHSPRPHGNISLNGSPPNPHALSPQKMLDLVDELCYLYPSEDFSLLRRAMITNEVSFTKLSPPLRKYNPASLSPSTSKSSTNDYITQQTLQMIRNQNEYLQLLQSGYANLSNMSPEIGNLTDHNQKYSSWFNVSPFAAAAAAGFNMPAPLGKNGYGSGDNGRKKHNEASTSQHTFASPKAPVPNSKSKTVAAVLAASRCSPNPSPTSFNKPKRPSQRRKPSHSRQTKSSTITRPPPEDDFIDPTSMLEVVTTKPSTFNNNYSFPSESESQGMDLSTTASPITQGTNHLMTTTSTLRSKAMNKDYGFLSDLGLVRKERSPLNGGHIDPMTSSTASLEHFVQNVLPHRKQSPPVTDSSTSRSPPSNEVNSGFSTESSEKTKNSVLEAFNFDSNLAGDARGVARKFGLNIRVVQKLIREAPTRSIPPSEILSNGGISMVIANPISAVLNGLQEHNDMNENLPSSSNFHRPLVANNVNGPTVNKRKNAKPNQIRDFTEDVEDNGPLDMIVPIKKRRVSTPTPTSG